MRQRQRKREREEIEGDRETERVGDRETETWFGLVGFLTSSSTTRLYRGRAPRQSV